MKIQSAQGDYEVQFVDSLGEFSYEDLVIADTKAVPAEQRYLNWHPLFGVDETLKTLPKVEDIIDEMQKRGITKKGRGKVIAIGGGTVQDAVAMACHLYHRGVPWIYYPTTLLSMADSCIGGKAGINHGGHKNLLGCFSAPSEVRICLKFLDTLPEVERWSGLGEAFKLLWISGIGEPNFDDIAAVIQRCLMVKRQYVEADEFEQCTRLHLSYGHTLAHALESLPGGIEWVRPIPHGLAVAAGMRFANWVSLQHGIMDAEDYDRADAQLTKFPVRVPDRKDELMAAMRLDKKATDTGVNMVLTSGPGKMEVYSVSFARLETHLSEFLAMQEG